MKPFYYSRQNSARSASTNTTSKSAPGIPPNLPIPTSKFARNQSYCPPKNPPKNPPPKIPEPKPEPLTEEFKQTICENSYLGNKGYTIPKTLLSTAEIQTLITETTITPKVMGPSFGPPGAANKDSAPCLYYKKDEINFYLPRAYGIARYGLPYETRLSFGRDVREALAFASDKPLRDYQTEIINVYLEHIRKQYLDFEVFEDEGAVDFISRNSETPITPDLLNPNQTHPLPPNPEPPKMERIEYGGGGILEVPCGRGKCLGKDTPILMFDGTIKMVQDVVVGDVLMGDDSGPRNVLTLARGKEMMYKIGCKKGDGYIVNESHILSLKYGTDMNRTRKKNTVLDISVTDYLNLPKYYHGRGGPLYGYRVPIVFPEKEMEMDPYLLGYWLGDGSSKGTLITTQEAVVIKYLVECFKTRHKTLYLKYTGYQYDYRINSTNPKTCDKSNIFMNFLRTNNLINNKHIPPHYKCNSRKNQLELLAGIIDSDGYYHDNCYEVVQKSEILLDDIMFLARSLGFGVYKRKMIKTCKNNGVSGTYFSVNICGIGLEEIPTKCMRKKAHPRKLLRDCLKYRITVAPIGIDDYYGFEIDGNRRFVLGDYTVTHNTVMALKIISEIGRPAMIYVNKGFLADQWLERIATYLPKASVGRIQADTFDVEGRDIVICMIQTVYDRDYTHYPAFRQFGITIIDECHRIGSGQFSKAMFNITTPYVLGISATVDRKDGMEKALNLFLGDVLYSDKRQDGDCVQIRSVEYSDPANVEYNKVEEDFRGNVKYSTMMSKICEHRPRLDFLFRILTDLVEEYPEDISGEFGCSPTTPSKNPAQNPTEEKRGETAECPVCRNHVATDEFIQTSCSHSFCEKCLDDLETPKCPLCKKRFSISYSVSEPESTEVPGINLKPLTEYPGQNQIIVLAQYRSVLKELHKRIQTSRLTTVGYYVGGMKQEELDISKTKQILLATYSMASEGLDVATLSTLVFATPRTDIKQSVGRILRQKHARNPIVVDVVDSHSTFKNQWSKRRAYYKQNSYVIYRNTCDQYTGMKNVEKTWKCIFSPKIPTAPKTGEKSVTKKGEDSDEDDSEAIRKMAFDGICML